MSKKIHDLQNACFTQAQTIATVRGGDYRGTYSRYIGELEGILTTLAIRDRVAQGEIEDLLEEVLGRFNNELAKSYKEMAG